MDQGSVATGVRPRRMFFIDSENGIQILLRGLETLTSEDWVVIFHRDSFSEKYRAKLEASRAAVEWISCCDPGVKNSMDVQIIAELSLRLAHDGFEEGYVVSRDKGFLPALHYLQMAKARTGVVLSLINSFADLVSGNVPRSSRLLQGAETVEEVELALTNVFGGVAADRIVQNLSAVFWIASHEGATDDAVEVACVDAVSDTPSDDEPETFYDLPGIGRALAARLELVGIENPARLREVGAVQAWRQVRALDSSFSSRWVYSLDAALNGITLNEMSPEHKYDLKREIKMASKEVA